MRLFLTTHAHARMQQRAIQLDALECLLEFSREALDHNGHAVIAYFDKERKGSSNATRVVRGARTSAEFRGCTRCFLARAKSSRWGTAIAESIAGELV
jgi:hypothetical protein